MRYLHRLDPEDFPDMEAYQATLSAYEDAESQYIEDCRESYYESKYNN